MLNIGVLFLSVVVGAFLVERFKISQRILRLLLAFSGAYLITVAFTHIVPEIFVGQDTEYLGYFVLVGFFVQLMIEYLSGGAEHGHGHCDENDHHQHPIGVTPYALLIGISIHAFFEGMPFSTHFHHCNHVHTQDSLLLGVVVHKLPIAIVLMGLLLASGMSKLKAYLLMGVFALAAPAGALLGGMIGESLNLDVQLYYKIVMAILVGIFLHVSTSIIFESNTSHRFNLYKFLTILAGVSLAILSNYLY